MLCQGKSDSVSILSQVGTVCLPLGSQLLQRHQHVSISLEISGASLDHNVGCKNVSLHSIVLFLQPTLCWINSKIVVVTPEQVNLRRVLIKATDNRSCCYNCY